MTREIKEAGLCIQVEFLEPNDSLAFYSTPAYSLSPGSTSQTSRIHSEVGLPPFSLLFHTDWAAIERVRHPAENSYVCAR
jgi:hypothetical protein